MTALNVIVSYQEDPSQPLHYTATYDAADTTYYGKAPQQFEFDVVTSGANNTSTFVAISDAATYGFNLRKNSVINSINSQYSKSFTVGNLVTVQDPVQTSIALMTNTEINALKSTMSIPSSTRTTSTISPSLVGTGATGTQVSSTKDSTVRLNVSTSTTSTIGGPSTSLVALKICSTNNATEASWATVATLENDQTITLAVVLNSIQVMKGQLATDLPAGWYYKLVNSGTGTHSESAITGQQTIYG